MKRLIAVFFATFMVFACSDEYQYNEIELGDGDIGASDKSISYSLRVGDTNNSANPPNWHFSQHDLCHLNLSQNVFSNGATMNNAITAFYIYPGYEITGCDFPNYGPPCYSYEHRVGGFSLAGTSRDNIFSSLEIRPMTPLWTTYTRLEDFPKDRENGFSENVQGVAHDENYWYISNASSIKKYHVSTSLNTNSWVSSLSVSVTNGNHFGDIDFKFGELFVPVEGGTPYRIYVFDNNFNFKRYGNIPSGTFAPWVAVNPLNSLMYSSDFGGGSGTNQIKVYPSIFPNGSNLQAIYTITLDRYIKRIQGGEFSDSGRLYLSSDSGDSLGNGIGVYVFKITGRNGVFEKYIPLPVVHDYGEELEGLTIWDVTGLNPPSISGQIHIMMLDDDVWSPDNVYFKHVSVDSPANL